MFFFFFLVRSNSCPYSTNSETINTSFFIFWNNNRRTSRRGLKHILQNIPWVMSNVYLAWRSEAAALIPALSATRVVLGYKRSSPCPQLISARLVIPPSMHIRPAVAVSLWSLATIFSGNFLDFPLDTIHMWRRFITPLGFTVWPHATKLEKSVNVCLMIKLY